MKLCIAVTAVVEASTSIVQGRVLRILCLVGGLIGGCLTNSCGWVESRRSPALEDMVLDEPGSPPAITADATSVDEPKQEPVRRRAPPQIIAENARPRATAPAATLGRVSAVNGGDITFSFVDADVRDVMREIVGTQLRLGYAVDPKVQAKITAETGAPIPRDAVLPALENILRASGVALVHAGDIYRAVALEDAGKESPASLAASRGGQSGFSVRVLPLKFVKAAELKPVLDAFVPGGGTMQVDESRNLIVVSGPAADLEGFAELVKQFDVDWIASKSFAVYPLHVGRAKEIVNEVQAVLDQAGKETGPLGGLIRVIPVERLNAVLIIASERSYLSEVRTLIDRLDYGDITATPRFFKYQVQNTRAVDLARVLRQMFSPNDVKIVTPEKAPGPNFTRLQANPPGMAGTLAPTLPGIPAPAAVPSSQRQQSADEDASAKPASNESAAPSELQLPQARIVADEKNNTIVVYSRPQDYRVIHEMLQQLDVAPQQVLIEATIAELTLNDELKYGLQYFLKSGASRFEYTTSNSGTLSASDIAGAFAFPGFNYIVASSAQHAILTLLKSVSAVKVLSSPHLLVKDNQTGGLQVGAQVPIVVQSAQSVTSAGAPIVNSIEYRNTGVILEVTPRINANGMISVDIDQEVSDVANTTSSQIDSPTINERHLVSSIMVHDGETIALGGLIREDSSDAKDGIPIVSEIPVLGPLFGTTNRSRGRTELIVLMSPRVVRGLNDERAMTDDLRNRIRALRPLGPTPRSRVLP